MLKRSRSSVGSRQRSQEGLSPSSHSVSRSSRLRTPGQLFVERGVISHRGCCVSIWTGAISVVSFRYFGCRDQQVTLVVSTRLSESWHVIVVVPLSWIIIVLAGNCAEVKNSFLIFVIFFINNFYSDHHRNKLGWRLLYFENSTIIICGKVMIE